ncbi:hypothetical protein MXD63_22280 [Frankia sp. Cpl3]|nr:hypothetical protein [Parafrankia colletiae]MCK9902788.1 hypothetical protein [Frankia sp. Cpl3]
MAAASFWHAAAALRQASAQAAIWGSSGIFAHMSAHRVHMSAHMRHMSFMLPDSRMIMSAHVPHMSLQSMSIRIRAASIVAPPWRIQ